MEEFKHLSTEELEKLWNEKRLSLKITSDKKVFQEGLDEVYAMKKELDRRKGIKNPTEDVNFSKEYLTD